MLVALMLISTLVWKCGFLEDLQTIIYICGHLDFVSILVM